MTEEQKTAQPNATMPSGAPAIEVTCPKCGNTYPVQFPSPEHRGEIYVECGCGQTYTYESPHGPAPVDPAKLEDTTGLNAAGERVDEEGNPVVEVSDAETVAAADVHAGGEAAPAQG